MKITEIKKYITPVATIEFVPVTDVPGYTHRISVNGELQQRWIPATQRADRTAAIFYARLYAALAEGREPYYYIDRQQDPPAGVKAA